MANMRTHSHNMVPYGKPFEMDGSLHQRQRCTICGGNTFIGKCYPDGTRTYFIVQIRDDCFEVRMHVGGHLIDKACFAESGRAKIKAEAWRDHHVNGLTSDRAFAFGILV